MDPSLSVLASVAGRAVVTAAVSDAWETTKRRFVRVLGRGDPEWEQQAERSLQDTRRQLQVADGHDLEQVRAVQAAAWQVRITHRLEEHPNTASNLQSLIDLIQKEQLAG